MKNDVKTPMAPATLGESLRSLDLDVLRAFVLVAETRSFTRAAERLNRGQSAVSMQMKRLEELTGCHILSRTRRRVELTPDGAHLLSYARRLLRLNDEALGSLDRGARTGKVRVGVTDTSMIYVSRILRAFAERCPLVQVEMTCGRSWEALADLEDGKIDLALVTQPCGHEGGRLLWREPLVWVAAADAEAEAREPLPLALFAPGCVYRDAVLRLLEAAGRDYRLVYSSANSLGLSAAVTAGIAVTIMPASAVGPNLRNVGKVAGLPELPELDLLLYLRESTAVGPRAFADTLFDLFA
ncbi:LysR substrate-binding domain-containing protein [Thalassobaculum sp. OXR-137]|uniref:LysR family transcriptional regulator n=1 Tax=Thalassobaculum sp. OXR-137 TaxID=3100173 RepID=UPI002AC9573E|nr:LysR substrate-binding domain-containing protein [Thalassobaculum sp. OXR-137]WPZ36668.1 LysR substrate-binding domain-containing protein [Thalassobaculum sp. OXR-137]